MRGFYLAGMLSVPAIGISLYGFEEFLVPSVIVFVAVAGFTLTIRVLESTRNNR